MATYSFPSQPKPRTAETDLAPVTHLGYTMGSGYGGSNSSIIFSGLTSATAPTTRCSSPVLADDDERLSDCSEYPSNQPLFLNFTSDLAPFNAAKKQKSRKSNVYKVSGVNILNRNSVESRTVMERIQRRRENHNFVERRRRDNINYTITELAGVIPAAHQDGAKLNKGSVLRMAVDYIRELQEENQSLRGRLGLSPIQIPSGQPPAGFVIGAPASGSGLTSAHRDSSSQLHSNYSSRRNSLVAAPLTSSTDSSTANTPSAARNSNAGPSPHPPPSFINPHNGFGIGGGDHTQPPTSLPLYHVPSTMGFNPNLPGLMVNGATHSPGPSGANMRSTPGSPHYYSSSSNPPSQPHTPTAHDRGSTSVHYQPYQIPRQPLSSGRGVGVEHGGNHPSFPEIMDTRMRELAPVPTPLPSIPNTPAPSVPNSPGISPNRPIEDLHLPSLNERLYNGGQPPATVSSGISIGNCHSGGVGAPLPPPLLGALNPMGGGGGMLMSTVTSSNGGSTAIPPPYLSQPIPYVQVKSEFPNSPHPYHHHQHPQQSGGGGGGTPLPSLIATLSNAAKIPSHIPPAAAAPATHSQPLMTGYHGPGSSTPASPATPTVIHGSHSSHAAERFHPRF